MSEIKISEMTEASQVTDNDYIPIIQNGVNKKAKAEKIGTGSKVLNANSQSTTDSYSANFINNNVGVVDSGSNENGEYVKFGDGTMICRINKNLNNIAFSQDYGNRGILYLARYTWTFPQPFNETNSMTVTCGTFKYDTGASFGSVNSFETTSATLMGYDLFNRVSGLNVHISATAIGKWK